jgi:hypothetical protein
MRAEGLVDLAVDGGRQQIQNRPVMRAASSIVTTALALALVVGAWTSGPWGTPASPLITHRITSAGGSGAEGGGDGVRSQIPCTVPRLIAGPAVIVGPLRLVSPPTAAVMPTPRKPYTTNRRLLVTRYSEHPPDHPHRHALPLLI